VHSCADNRVCDRSGSPANVHPNSAFIYATILQGAIPSQLNDVAVETCCVAGGFSEFFPDRHGVSGNASTTEPAPLLTVVVD
jgi:hypothetical protein